MKPTRRELALALGYTFGDETLLTRALTHRSRGSVNYERLEFLGDSVLNFLVADLLYDRFTTLPEGDLTRWRASLVRQETLAAVARAIQLGDYLELGSGELKSGGFDRDSILADALEAVLGAIYKEAGMGTTRAVVQKLFADALAAIEPGSLQKDPKTRLQEHLQRHSQPIPTYDVVSISGEAHAQHFVVACRVILLPEAIHGEGNSRRGAEQAAAACVCELLHCDSNG